MRGKGSYNNSMKNRTSSQAQNNSHASHTTTVYTTASLVTFLSVAERGLGFLYRIVLSRLIGAEGLGLYQVSLSLFSVFLTVGTGGIPITVSRLISKSKAEKDLRGESNAFSSGVMLSLLLTLPVLLVFLPFGERFTFLFSDVRAAEVFKILLLGLVFSALYAVIRGFLWGNKRFLTGSVLEIAEETVMVIAGVCLLRRADSSLSGAKLAAWAVVISYLFSFTTSALCYFFGGGRLSNPTKALKPMFRSTMPITTVRASSSLVNSAVAVLLPAMLIRAGATSSEALRLFGVVSGMAVPVLFIPATVIGSLALVLVPELSEDYYGKHSERLHKNLERGLRIAFLVACVLLPFFYALGNELGALAFSDDLAGEIIVKGCVILLPMSLTMITTSMLNSMGYERQTFIFYFIGAAVTLLCIVLLPAVCGVYAYVVGLGASFLINAVCNIVLLAQKCPKLFTKYGKRLAITGTKALLAVLPLSLLGKLLSVLFSRVLSAFFAAVCTALLLSVATAVLYFLLGIASVRGIKEACFTRKTKKSAKK